MNHKLASQGPGHSLERCLAKRLGGQDGDSAGLKRESAGRSCISPKGAWTLQGIGNTMDDRSRRPSSPALGDGKVIGESRFLRFQAGAAGIAKGRRLRDTDRLAMVSSSWNRHFRLLIGGRSGMTWPGGSVKSARSYMVSMEGPSWPKTWVSPTGHGMRMKRDVPSPRSRSSAFSRSPMRTPTG